MNNTVIEVAPNAGYLHSSVAQDDCIYRCTDSNKALRFMTVSNQPAPLVLAGSTGTFSNLVVTGTLTASNISPASSGGGGGISTTSNFSVWWQLTSNSASNTGTSVLPATSWVYNSNLSYTPGAVSNLVPSMMSNGYVFPPFGGLYSVQYSTACSSPAVSEAYFTHNLPRPSASSNPLAWIGNTGASGAMQALLAAAVQSQPSGFPLAWSAGGPGGKQGSASVVMTSSNYVQFTQNSSGYIVNSGVALTASNTYPSNGTVLGLQCICALSNLPVVPYPTFTSPMNDEFISGTLDPKWSWQAPNSGGSTLSTMESNCYKLGAPLVTGWNSVCGITQPLPTGNWTFATSILKATYPTTYDWVYPGGIMLTSGTASGSSGAYLMTLTGTTYPKCVQASYCTWFTGQSQLGLSATNIYSSAIYLQVSKSGSTYTMAYSFDNVTYTNVYSGTLTFTPTLIGLISCSQNASVQAVTWFDWFRRIS